MTGDNEEKDKAKAAVCRTVSRCTSGDFMTCNYCEFFRDIYIDDTEYKIQEGRVLVKKVVIARSRHILRI